MDVDAAAPPADALQFWRGQAGLPRRGTYEEHVAAKGGAVREAVRLLATLWHHEGLPLERRREMLDLAELLNDLNKQKETE